MDMNKRIFKEIRIQGMQMLDFIDTGYDLNLCVHFICYSLGSKLSTQK